eukprot:g7.t1
MAAQLYQVASAEIVVSERPAAAVAVRLDGSDSGLLIPARAELDEDEEEHDVDFDGDVGLDDDDVDVDESFLESDEGAGPRPDEDPPLPSPEELRRATAFDLKKAEEAVETEDDKALDGAFPDTAADRADAKKAEKAKSGEQAGEGEDGEGRQEGDRKAKDREKNDEGDEERGNDHAEENDEDEERTPEEMQEEPNQDEEDDFFEDGGKRGGGAADEDEDDPDFEAAKRSDFLSEKVSEAVIKEQRSDIVNTPLHNIEEALNKDPARVETVRVYFATMNTKHKDFLENPMQFDWLKQGEFTTHKLLLDGQHELVLEALRMRDEGVEPASPSRGVVRNVLRRLWSRLFGRRTPYWLLAGKPATEDDVGESKVFQQYEALAAPAKSGKKKGKRAARPYGVVKPDDRFNFLINKTPGRGRLETQWKGTKGQRGLKQQKKYKKAEIVSLTPELKEPFPLLFVQRRNRILGDGLGRLTPWTPLEVLCVPNHFYWFENNLMDQHERKQRNYARHVLSPIVASDRVRYDGCLNVPHPDTKIRTRSKLRILDFFSKLANRNHAQKGVLARYGLAAASMAYSSVFYAGLTTGVLLIYTFTPALYSYVGERVVANALLKVAGPTLTHLSGALFGQQSYVTSMVSWAATAGSTSTLAFPLQARVRKMVGFAANEHSDKISTLILHALNPVRVQLLNVLGFVGLKILRRRTASRPRCEQKS